MMGCSVRWSPLRTFVLLVLLGCMARSAAQICPDVPERIHLCGFAPGENCSFSGTRNQVEARCQSARINVCTSFYSAAIEDFGFMRVYLMLTSECTPNAVRTYGYQMFDQEGCTGNPLGFEIADSGLTVGGCTPLSLPLVASSIDFSFRQNCSLCNDPRYLIDVVIDEATTTDVPLADTVPDPSPLLYPTIDSYPIATEICEMLHEDNSDLVQLLRLSGSSSGGTLKNMVSTSVCSAFGHSYRGSAASSRPNSKGISMDVVGYNTTSFPINAIPSRYVWCHSTVSGSLELARVGPLQVDIFSHLQCSSASSSFETVCHESGYFIFHPNGSAVSSIIFDIPFPDNFGISLSHINVLMGPCNLSDFSPTVSTIAVEFEASLACVAAMRQSSAYSLIFWEVGCSSPTVEKLLPIEILLNGGPAPSASTAYGKGMNWTLVYPLPRIADISRITSSHIQFTSTDSYDIADSLINISGPDDLFHSLSYKSMEWSQIGLSGAKQRVNVSLLWEESAASLADPTVQFHLTSTNGMPFAVCNPMFLRFTPEFVVVSQTPKHFGTTVRVCEVISEIGCEEGAVRHCTNLALRTCNRITSLDLPSLVASFGPNEALSLRADVVRGRVSVRLYTMPNCNPSSLFGDAPIFEDFVGACRVQTHALPPLLVLKQSATMTDSNVSKDIQPKTREITIKAEDFIGEGLLHNSSVVGSQDGVDVNSLNTNSSLWYMFHVENQGTFRVVVHFSCTMVVSSTVEYPRPMVAVIDSRNGANLSQETLFCIPGLSTFIDQPLTTGFVEIPISSVERGMLWIKLSNHADNLTSSYNTPTIVIDSISVNFDYRSSELRFSGNISSDHIEGNWTPTNAVATHISSTRGGPAPVVLQWNTLASSTIHELHKDLVPFLQFRIVGNGSSALSHTYNLTIPLSMSRLSSSTCNEFGVLLWNASGGQRYTFTVSLETVAGTQLSLNRFGIPSTATVSIRPTLLKPQGLQVTVSGAQDPPRVTWDNLRNNQNGYIVAVSCVSVDSTLGDHFDKVLFPVIGSSVADLIGLPSSSECQVSVAAFRRNHGGSCSAIDQSTFISISDFGTYGMENIRSACLDGFGAVDVGPSTGAVTFSTPCIRLPAPIGILAIVNDTAMDTHWMDVEGSIEYVLEWVSVENNQSIVGSFRRVVVANSERKIYIDEFDLHFETWIRVLARSATDCDGMPSTWYSVAAQQGAVSTSNFTVNTLSGNDAQFSWDAQIHGDASNQPESVVYLLGPIDTKNFDWTSQACDGCGIESSCILPCSKSAIMIVSKNGQNVFALHGLLADRMYMAQLVPDASMEARTTELEHTYILMPSASAQESESSPGRVSSLVALILVIVTMFLCVFVIVILLRRKARGHREKRTRTVTSTNDSMVELNELVQNETVGSSSLSAIKVDTINFFSGKFGHLGDPLELLERLEVQRDTVDIDIDGDEAPNTGCVVGTVRLESATISTSVLVIEDSRDTDQRRHAVEALAEAVLLKALQNYRIANCLGVAISDKFPLYILHENAPRLDRWVQKKHFNISDTESVEALLCVCIDIAEALRFLAEKKILLKLLRAQSVCVVDSQPKIRLEGAVCKYHFRGADGSLNSSVRWMAPEVLVENIFSTKADVFAFGILVWEVFNRGVIPYSDMSDMDVLAESETDPHRRLPDVETPSELNTILHRCWTIDPEERPACAELVEDLHKLKSPSSTKGTIGKDNGVDDRSQSPAEEDRLCELYGLGGSSTNV